jgi:Flp pilus assembly protein TadG
MSGRGRRCRGSTLVESAIVLMLFLVILIGVMDFGQVLFFHHFLNERVRSGARYAIVHAYDPAAVKNVVAYNSPTVPPGAVPLFGLSPAQVSVNRYDAGTANDRIEVSVNTFSMHFISPWLMRDFTPGPFRAVMPLESGGRAE